MSYGRGWSEFDPDVTRATCTFCALGALKRKVTRASSSIRGYWTPGKLYGEGCAGTAGAEAERSGAGTISCLAAGVESFGDFFVWDKQDPPANTAASRTDTNDFFMSCNLLINYCLLSAKNAALFIQQSARLGI